MTLAEAAEGEQKRRGDADGAVGGQEADGNGGEAHDREGEHERGLAADAIAEVAKERGADGTGEEGDAEGGERGEGGAGGIGRGEEEAREDEHGGRGVDVEVEELDGGADEASKENLSWSVDGSVDGGVDGGRRAGRHV